jgi:hypothetical protein
LYVKSVLPEDGDGAIPRNVVFKRIDAAVRPRKLYCTLSVLSLLFLKVNFVNIVPGGWEYKSSYTRENFDTEYELTILVNR